MNVISFMWMISASTEGDGSAEYPFQTIQDGLTMASSGDIVQVADGTYSGSNNTNLGFSGKAVTLRSQNGPEACVRPAALKAFYPHELETTATVVEGFTLRNSTLSQSVIRIGTASIRSGLTVRDCIFHTDQSQYGTVMCENSEVVLINCLFYNNTTNATGAVYVSTGGTATITNCTVVDNVLSQQSPWGAGGITVSNSSATVRNSIVWGNTNGLQGQISSGQDIKYCCVQGGYGVETDRNLSADPLFMNAAGRNYRLVLEFAANRCRG